MTEAAPSTATVAPAYCRGCGTGARPGASFCPACGAPMLALIPPPAVAPPGWWGDPGGGHLFRWWDGARWTGWVSDGDTPVWDPPVLPAVEEPSTQTVVRAGVTAAVGFVGGIALSLAGQLALVALGRPGGAAASLAVGTSGIWIGLFGSAWLASRRKGTGNLARDYGLSFRPVDAGIGLVASLAARVLAGLVIAPVVAAFPALARHRVTVGPHAPGAAGLAVVVVAACIGAPLFEEIFFRGLLQGTLVARIGPVAGIGVTSLLFGTAHLVAWQGVESLVYALAIAASGTVLGFVRHRTGRLGTSIATHSLFNALAVGVAAAAS